MWGEQKHEIKGRKINEKNSYELFNCFQKIFPQTLENLFKLFSFFCNKRKDNFEFVIGLDVGT